MADVQFEEDFMKDQGENGKSTPRLVRLIMKMKLAKTEKQANVVLFLLAIVFFALSIYFFMGAF